jgi:hypothetical protein
MEIYKGDFLMGSYGMSRVVEVGDSTVFLEDHTVENINAIRPVVITEELLKKFKYSSVVGSMAWKYRGATAWTKGYYCESTKQWFQITIWIYQRYNDVRPISIAASFENATHENSNLITNIEYLHDLQHILKAFKLKETFGYDEKKTE